jgi:hypothetical protein
MNRSLAGWSVVRWSRVAAAGGSLLLWQTLVSAQVNLTGGVTLADWGTTNCSTAITINNVTGLPMAGLWVAFNNDGIYNAPDIQTITSPTWLVDDDENFVLLGAPPELDFVDSTPFGPMATNGWHRIHAPPGGMVVPAGGSISLTLCRTDGMPIGGSPTMVALIPIAPVIGQTHGDNGKRTTPQVSIKKSAPTGSTSVDPISAPPGSTSFSFAVKNTSTTNGLSKVTLTPPTGVTITATSASGPGVMVSGDLRTITWQPPIPAGGSEQVSLTVSTLVASSLITTITVTGTFPTGGTGSLVPALPAAALAVLAGAALVGLALVLRRGSS